MWCDGILEGGRGGGRGEERREEGREECDVDEYEDRERRKEGTKKRKEGGKGTLLGTKSFSLLLFFFLSLGLTD